MISTTEGTPDPQSSGFSRDSGSVAVPGCPAGLGERGSGLWLALHAGGKFDAAGEALVVEACRLADRLDQLDDVISGKGVLQLLRFRSLFDSDDERHLVMTVDGVLGEARQQANTLRQIVATLGLGRVAEIEPPKSAEVGPDQLAARRADRRAAYPERPVSS